MKRLLAAGALVTALTVGAPFGIALAAAGAPPSPGPGGTCQVTGHGAQLAASAALAAGFPAEQVITAVAIAGAESGYDPAATHLNSDGSTDYGLWQINSIHTVLLTQGDWLRRLDGHLPFDIAQGGGVRRDSRSPLRSALLRWVLLVMLTVGVGLSLLDLAVVARAAGSGNPGAAGYLLAAGCRSAAPPADCSGDACSTDAAIRCSWSACSWPWQPRRGLPHWSLACLPSVSC